MAVTVAHFIAVEMRGIYMFVCVIAPIREPAVIAVVRAEVVIHVAVKTSGAMEPWAGAKEHAAIEPLGSIVAVRGAVIRRNVIVTVRAVGSRSDVDAKTDLGIGAWCYRQ